MLCICSAVLVLGSCMRDKFVEAETECGIENVTYNKDIAPIIEQTCAYSGCHDGVQQTRYSSYSELTEDITNNTIFDEVIESRDMPPSYAENGPTELTEEQYNLFACWAEAGYPEN